MFLVQRVFKSKPGKVPTTIPRTEASKQPEDPPFPWIVKDGLVFLYLDGTETVHAPHVVNAIHGSCPYGAEIFVTPTIESRVTIAASSSSVMFSVPAGRSGSMR